MKQGLSALLFLAVSSSVALGQGLVNFLNNSTTLISILPPSGSVVIGPPASSYYFALLTAPVGTTDPTQFQFSGAYATNLAAAGRISGGTSVAIPGWSPGTTRAFEVVGWSSDFGHDFHQSWLANPPWYQGNWFGISSIGQGIAGGTDSMGQSFPNLSIFGGAPSISFGIALSLIPEPGICALTVLASCMVLLRRRSSGASRERVEKAILLNSRTTQNSASGKS